MVLLADSALRSGGKKRLLRVCAQEPRGASARFESPRGEPGKPERIDQETASLPRLHVGDIMHNMQTQAVAVTDEAARVMNIVDNFGGYVFTACDTRNRCPALVPTAAAPVRGGGGKYEGRQGA